MAAGQTFLSTPVNAAVAARKRRDRFEFCAGYGLILLVIWTPSPWQRPLYLVAALFLFAVSWRSFESRAAIGLRTANLLRSSWVVALAVLGSAAAVALAARLGTLRPWHGPVELIQRFWGYAIWSFAQQFLLMDFFLRRLLRLLPGKRTAVAAAAGLFAFAHLPNPVLAPATLIWGAAACMLFLRYRNLYTLAVTHAIFGITVAVCVPGPVTHNMRVGLGYLAYNPRQHHRHDRLSGQSDAPSSPQPNRP